MFIVKKINEIMPNGGVPNLKKLEEISRIRKKKDTTKRVFRERVEDDISSIPDIGEVLSNSKPVLRHGGSAVYLTHREVILQRQKSMKEKEDEINRKEDAAKKK